MLLDISQAFINRPSVKELDNNSWNRIISAYGKAKEAEKSVPSYYRPSLVWSSIYQNGYMSESISALMTADIPECKRLFGNFFRENLSAGLIGFSMEMPKIYMNRNSAPTPDELNTYFYFIKNRMERFVKNHPGLDLKALVRPNIGNPYGYEIDENFINICAEGAFNYSSQVSKLLRGSELSSLLELGGGYGGFAYFLMRDNPNMRYTGVDLPENLALQSFYLMTAFPEKKFLLYGEQEGGVIKTDEFDVVLLPGFEAGKFYDNQFDLFFNSYSLGEMSAETVEKYISVGCRVTKKYLYHINVNNGANHTNSDYFPIDFNKFDLFLRYPDMWLNLNGEGSAVEVNEYIYLAKNEAAFHVSK